MPGGAMIYKLFEKNKPVKGHKINNFNQKIIMDKVTIVRASPEIWQDCPGTYNLFLKDDQGLNKKTITVDGFDNAVKMAGEMNKTVY